MSATEISPIIGPAISDGSNAYQHDISRDIPGVYQNKEGIRYPILIIDPITKDQQHGLVWWFPKAGGEILSHSHKFWHSTVLIRGSIIVTGEAEGRNDIALVAHDTIKFNAGVKHSIRTLVDDTHFIHLYPINVTGDSE